MILEIGILAGEILELLDNIKGPLTVTEMEIRLKQSRESVLMSLGWLIREGIITMDDVGGNVFFEHNVQSINDQVLNV